MARQSITERYDRLAQRGDSLAGRHLETISPVHIATLEVLRELLNLGTIMSTNQVPVALRTLLRTLNRLEPVLLDELANVPPESIVVFMRDMLLPPIQRIIDAYPEGVLDAGDDGRATGQLGSDLATPA